MTILKRVLFVLGIAIFSGLCFFIFVAPELELSTPAAYKFMTGMTWFFDFLPATFFAGITIGYSFAFGRAHIVKKERFSQRFGIYLKQIVLVSLCSTVLCFIAKEIGTPLIETRQVKLVEKSQDLRKYLLLAQEAYDKQDYNLASFYIKSALDINSKHQEVLDPCVYKDSDILLKNKMFSMQNLQKKKTTGLSQAEIGLVQLNLYKKHKNVSIMKIISMPTITQTRLTNFVRQMNRTKLSQ